MQHYSSSIVILAAGKGTRLGAAEPKPLVKLAGTPLIAPILSIARSLPFCERIVCISTFTAAIKEHFAWPELSYVTTEPLGTGHAVLQALPFVTSDYFVVAQADDSFFMRQASIPALIEQHIQSRAVATMALAPLSRNLPYAWVAHSNGYIQQIHKKADALHKEPPKDVGAGLYCFSTSWLRTTLPQVQPGPSGEIPLPGVLDIALAQEQAVASYLLQPDEWHGINTPQELEQALNRLTSE